MKHASLRQNHCSNIPMHAFGSSFSLILPFAHFKAISHIQTMLDPYITFLFPSYHINSFHFLLSKAYTQWNLATSKLDSNLD